MAEASIPVDIFNPGQVFACLGFMDAADVICGAAEAGFDWSRAADARFVLRTAGLENPFAGVLQFLEDAEVEALAPRDSRNKTEGWNVRTRVLPAGEPFPFPDPDSPATLPVALVSASHRLVIDHWGDATRRDNVKFWAGAAGYPGAALARDALDLARPFLQSAASDPFAASAVQSSSFRFDWRRDYIPIDAGFSLNNAHPTSIQSLGYPLVELLAALGMSHARPARVEKLEYRYGIAGRAHEKESAEAAFLPPVFLRAALGCSPLPLPMRSFRMSLNWPGQEGQARSITSVSEETR